jgi:hypothetical protein
MGLFALAACGSDHGGTPDSGIQVTKDAAVDAKVFMDAPPPQYDFSCMSNPAPGNGDAAANVTYSGTAQEIDVQGTTPSISAASGATLNACAAGAADCNDTNKLAGPVTSADDGSWTLGPIPTNTNPLNGYISFIRSGDKDVYVYPPQPLIADQGMVPLLTFTPNAFGLVALAASANQSATKGAAAVLFTDCANTPISDDITVSVKQGGTAVSGFTDFNLGGLAQQAAGLHVIFNIPVGDTELGGTVGTMPFRAHVVHVFQGAVTETIVRPGYF